MKNLNVEGGINVSYTKKGMILCLKRNQRTYLLLEPLLLMKTVCKKGRLRKRTEETYKNST